MNRRSFFQRLGSPAGAGVVADRVAAQQLCDRAAVQRPSIDEMLYERTVIGNDLWNVIPKNCSSVGAPVRASRGQPGNERETDDSL